MTRRNLILVLVCVALTTLVPTTAAFAGGEGVGFGEINPGSGPPGTEISYTVAGSPNADAECRGSSAFATELLGSDGVRLATGSDTVAVPDTATAGPGFVRLICYIADTTGRRVIHGFCGAFEVTAAGSAPGAPTIGPVNDPCPATARLVVSDSILRAATNLGLSFNQVITPLGG